MSSTYDAKSEGGLGTASAVSKVSTSGSNSMTDETMPREELETMDGIALEKESTEFAATFVE